MGSKKNNGSLILPDGFIAELRGVLDIGPKGCRVGSRQVDWLGALLDNFGLNGFSPEELGVAYEQIHSDRKRRKKGGVFYTPPEVVSLILDETLNGWCASHPGKIPIVLEPACGAGAFVMGILERVKLLLDKCGDDYPGLPRALTDHLHVNDIDPAALAVTMMCILRKLALLNEPVMDDVRLNASGFDFLETKLWFDESGKPVNGKHYDVIVGNPPYISYYAKGSQGITEEKRAEWGKHFISAKGRVNTYLLFIEMAIKLLNPGGRLGFIVPNTFLIMKSYEKLRSHVLDTCHLRYIADLSAGIFAGAEVPCCIVVLEKRDPAELPLDHPVKVLRPAFNEGDFKVGMEHPRSGALKTGFNESSEEISLDAGRFRGLPYMMFNVGMDSATCEILDRMESGAEQLKAFVDVRDGINPANVKSKIVFPTRDGPNFKPVLVGRDIKPFNLEWSGLFVNYDVNAIDKSKGEYCFLREERIFLAERKLVNRQTARRLIAALDQECYYALNSCHLTLVEDDRLDIHYLLALYNSDVLNFYYASVFRDTEKVFPQVKTVNIEKLPLKFGDPDVLASIVSTAVELSQNGLDKATRDEMTGRIDAHLAGVYDLSDKQVEYMHRRVPI